ncbi:hypothetical protein [Amycolatopsis australiensis]|uniref:hypothetical protein n=1 Tax=Amycolatopsis australiensis TaxID=546364 RepID=UPI0031832880
MQLYCGIDTTDPAAPSAYAKRLARHLARETSDRVTAVMAKPNAPTGCPSTGARTTRRNNSAARERDRTTGIDLEVDELASRWRRTR